MLWCRISTAPCSNLQERAEQLQPESHSNNEKQLLDIQIFLVNCMIFYQDSECTSIERKYIFNIATYPYDFTCNTVIRSPFLKFRSPLLWVRKSKAPSHSVLGAKR